MENRLGWLLLRWLLVLWRYLVVLVLAFGIALGAGSVPAHAYCVGSSLCNPANAPILAELAGSGAAPAGVTATATGSSITSPLAAQTATTAGGSSIAAEVWGGVAAVALSAAGWLGAKAFLGEGDIPEEVPGGGGGYRKEIDHYWARVRTLPPPTTYMPMESTGTVKLIAEYDPALHQLVYGFAGLGDVLPATGWNATQPTQVRYRQCGKTTTSGSYNANTSVSRIEDGWSRTLALPTCVDLLTIQTARAVNQSGSPTSWGPEIDLLQNVPSELVMAVETILNCTGSGQHVYRSDNFSEIPADGVALPMRLCPDGEKVTSTQVWLRVIGQPALDVLLSETVVPQYLQDIIPDDCVKAATADCELDLQLDGQSVVGKIEHANWDISPKAHSYRCSYGGSVVDIKFCRAAYGSQPRKSVPVPLNEPLPTTTPVPYPSTGPEWPPLGEPEPPTPGTDSGSCVRWSLSSILSGEVMFQAVGCALEWAFVPDQATLTATAALMQVSWYTSGPVMFMTEGSGIVTATGDKIGALMSGNCQGPAIDLPNYDEPLYLLNACDPPVSTVAGWTHLGSAFVFAFFGLVGALRVVLAAFNIHLPWSKSTAEQEGAV